MTESYVGQIRQFQLNTSDWSIYKPHLLNYFVANEINNNVRKRAIFLNMLDEESYKLITSLCQPDSPDITPFATLMLLFDRQLAPQQSIFAERYKFYNAMRYRGESAKDWAARVENLAAPCQFGSALEVSRRDKFVFGFEEYFFCLIEDADITFEDAVKLAQEHYDQHSDNYYHKLSSCYNSLYMFRGHNFCPFGCCVRSLHLSDSHWCGYSRSHPHFY